MPAYPIPPWLQPPDTGALYSHGLQIGAQQAMQTQRIQAEAAQQAAEMGYKQAAEAFKQQQMARLEQQDANEQARWNAEYGLKASEAAEKHRAIQGYQADLASGMDPTEAILKHGPAMTGQASPEAAALRSQMTAKRPPIAAPQVEKYAGEDFLMVPDANGRLSPYQIRHAPPPKPTTEGKLTQLEAEELRDLERKQARLEKAHSDNLMGKLAVSNPKDTANSKAAMKVYQNEEKQLNDFDAKISAIRQGALKRTGGGGMTAPDDTEESSNAAPPMDKITAPDGGFPPFPRDPSKREKGKTYMTPKGPHTWNGESWDVYAEE